MNNGYSIKPEEFDIDFMHSHNYVRKKCKYCGVYFWTNDPDREDCGEPPCGSYEFLKNPPTKRKYTVSALRNSFLKFFEKNGHEIIDPYPVVSRWRDDLLITIASIADFQPYVTSGISEPPANPLVISQPCLRFEDIHNVGLTAGRHLTIFEMGGAHAFNKKDSWIYWKNETIEYHHRFATEILGIPEDNIIYKEHFWVGGGNAGPDLEGIIKGLEVSTLVFMKYKVIDNKLIDIPISTVDTGYGIERWAWLSTGSPTAFHVIYGKLVDKILDWAELKLDDEIIYLDTFYSGQYNAKSMYEVYKLRQKIASKFGIDGEELNKKLDAMNKLFSVLDHIKGAIFLIKDGAMPSNVKEGYLTRLLLRRSFRALSKYNMIDYLESLIDEEVKLWGNDFDEIRELEHVIFDVILLEYKKYKDTIKRGEHLVTSMIKRKGGLSLDDLIVLYDSHGLPPDYVAEVASKYGVNVQIPKDFHSIVAYRHQTEQPEVPKELEEIPEKFRTERVYYEDTYKTEIIAQVIFVKNNKVILDKTIFYPQGGGQAGDSGYLIRLSDNVKIRVIETKMYGENVVHIVSEPCPLNIGDKVKAVLDWDKRYSLMRNHTATHIILAAAKRVLGGHVWQTGAEKNPEYGRLDITHYKGLTREEISKIELLANEIVSKGINVEISYLERGEAERLFGPQIYQGGVVPGKYVRVVKIGDWDVEACGGTHVKDTREIMLIKIVGVEKIHEGVIRLIYKTGFNAIKEFQDTYQIITEIANLLNSPKKDILSKVSVLLRENKELKKYVKELNEEILKSKADKLYKSASFVDVKNKIKLILTNVDNVEDAITLGEYLENRFSKFIFIGHLVKERGFILMIFVSKDLRSICSAAEIGNEIKNLVKGGGKGDNRYYRLGGPGKIDPKLIRHVVTKYVEGKCFK